MFRAISRDNAVLAAVLFAVMLLTGSNASAQFLVNTRGGQPSINDFVTAALSNDGEEFARGAQENWTRRQQGKPLDDGASFIVDAKNGYARYDKRYTSDTYSYVEFCYWNCSDRTQKIVAVNSGCVEHGRHVSSEFTTLKFYTYDTQTKAMEWLSRQDIGAAINVSSTVSYALPQTGKNIMATIHSGTGDVQILMKWDGAQFHQEQVGQPEGNVQVSKPSAPVPTTTASPAERAFGETVKYKDADYIRVHTAEQFINVLGSNRNVLVAKDTEINLSEVLNDQSHFRTRYKMWMPDVSTGIDGGRETVVSEEVFDGRQLTLVNMKQLVIEGEQNSRIVAEPRYAFCLRFVDCHQCTVSNLTIGHTDAGYCEGGVIGVKRGWSNMVIDCDLYGCGTYGLEIDGTNSFDLFSSKIHDCTYGIMLLRDSEAVHCTHCDFLLNREFDLIESHGCVGTVFEDCRFFANSGDSPLFSFDREFTLLGCAVYHPTENLGTMDLCQQPSTSQPNTFNPNPIDNNIESREIGPDGHGVHTR